MNTKRTFNEKIIHVFEIFEKYVTLVLAVIIALIILFALVRIGIQFYDIFIQEFDNPESISFKNYQTLFGRILTLLISIEFMNSILHVFRSHNLRTLVLDVVLITGLAVARKLIVMDYEHKEPMAIIGYACILISIGVFYFLVRTKKFRMKGEDDKSITE